MLTMEMVLHKNVDFAPKFGKNQFKYISYLCTVFLKTIKNKHKES